MHVRESEGTDCEVGGLWSLSLSLSLSCSVAAKSVFYSQSHRSGHRHLQMLRYREENVKKVTAAAFTRRQWEVRRLKVMGDGDVVMSSYDYVTGYQLPVLRSQKILRLANRDFWYLLLLLDPGGPEQFDRWHSLFEYRWNNKITPHSYLTYRLTVSPRHRHSQLPFFLFAVDVTKNIIITYSKYEVSTARLNHSTLLLHLTLTLTLTWRKRGQHRRELLIYRTRIDKYLWENGTEKFVLAVVIKK